MKTWGFDNGAYFDWINNREFDGGAFYQRLKQAYKMGVPYIAVCPDMVAQGEDRLAFPLSYWRFVFNHDWPWYLAVQDGMTLEMVEPHLKKIAGIFLGGTNEFKFTAPIWSELAHKHGKKLHYARTGNLRKSKLAFAAGADSLDSTIPL
ncbi:hypothetical protein [Pelosinus baikalensis]|uniref:Uncharacterized protein n=1 Tax=Pelosinus baikalensis TaxID=2892015 RepID=A0ABS8HYU4_9FIRM|nr:hypothetical protein [Pelosinus baikalensis]MCC5468335.1 hypothetical protein [Pelosinus baikalensis]